LTNLNPSVFSVFDLFLFLEVLVSYCCRLLRISTTEVQNRLESVTRATTSNLVTVPETEEQNTPLTGEASVESNIKKASGSLLAGSPIIRDINNKNYQLDMKPLHHITSGCSRHGFKTVLYFCSTDPFSKSMIRCNWCMDWYHDLCVGITKSETVVFSVCPACSMVTSKFRALSGLFSLPYITLALLLAFAV
jgi:hypothetical protein